jgi:hypothetical protein
LVRLGTGFRFPIVGARETKPNSKCVAHLFFSAIENPKLFYRLVDQTVVEGLLYVGLLGFGMIDKLQRVGHRLLRRPERAGESFPVKFKTSLQNRFIFDSGKFSERLLRRCCVFPDELLSSVIARKKFRSRHGGSCHPSTTILGSNDSRRKQTIFGVRRSKEQMETFLLGLKPKGYLIMHTSTDHPEGLRRILQRRRFG